MLTGLGELDGVPGPHGAEPPHGGRVALVDDEVDGDLPTGGVGRGDRVDARGGDGGVGDPVELVRLEGDLDADSDIGGAPRPPPALPVLRTVVEAAAHAPHAGRAALDPGDRPPQPLVAGGVVGVLLEQAEELRGLGPLARAGLCHGRPPLCE